MVTGKALSGLKELTGWPIRINLAEALASPLDDPGERLPPVQTTERIAPGTVLRPSFGPA
jgi:hypothetical protein